MKATELSQMTESQILADLRELTEAVGSNHYQRIKLADQLMQRREWIASSFKGDDYRAAEMLEEEFFHDLSGAMTIWNLLTIYRKFPLEKDWKAKQYNLRMLLSACKPPVSEKAGKQERKSVKYAEFEATQQRAKEAEFQLKRKEKEIESYRLRVTELEQENSRLHGRVEQLERIVKGKLSA